MKLKTNKIYYFLTILLLIGFCLTPLIWFWGKGNVLINGVDTNFPINPLIWFIRRFFIWNEIGNAGSNFTSSTAGIFFHFVQVIPYLLKFKLQYVEIFSLIFWFSAIVLSSNYFAKYLFSRNYLSRLIFITIYCFNTYIFNTWENVKVANISLMVGIPLVLGIVTEIYNKTISFKKIILLSIVSGILLTGSGINPAYFICLLLSIFIYSGILFINSQNKKFFLKGLVIVLFIIIFINIFWIIPTLLYLFKNVSISGSITEIGFTNWVDSLSENTNIFNVLRIQGAWDWYATDSVTGLPLYTPYALNYFHKVPFIIFSLLIPTLAFSSLIFRKKEYSIYYLIFSLMVLIGVFLGTGTHSPTGVFYKYLLEHIPFFSFFRSPWYIFTPILITAYAGLIGILFEYLSGKFKLFWITAIAFVLIIGNLVYCYPLVTGKIFRPNRGDSFYVLFPKYVIDAGKWLNEQSLKGRVLSFPEDEIENFKWGYRGIESILQLISKAELIYLSLNETNTPVATLTKESYNLLKKNEINSFLSLASKLNIEYIFEKNDQISISPVLPNLIKENYKLQKFGLWNFYKIPENHFQPKIYMANNIFSSYSYENNKTGLALLNKNDILVNSQDSVVKSIKSISENSGVIISSKNVQERDFDLFINSLSNLKNRLNLRNLSKGEFEFTVFNDGDYQIVLENYKLLESGIDANKSLKVIVNNKEIIIFTDKISDSYIYFRPIKFKKGDYKLVIPLGYKNLVKGGNFEEEKFKKDGYGEGKVVFSIEEDSLGRYLSLLNYDKAEQSANFNIDEFDHMSSYYIKLRYKQVYGNNALVVVSQQTPQTLIKAQSERLPNYPEWREFGFYFDPVETSSTMKISLIAPFTSDALGTKIYYDDLEVYKVFTNKLVLVNSNSGYTSTPEIKFEKKSPVLYQGEVYGAIGPHILVFSENYSNGWKIRLFDQNNQLIKHKDKHFSANLFANAWYFENVPSSYKFKIYYQPQNIYILSLIISGIVVFGSVLLAFRSKESS